jgi:FkbM family methyltransferase
MNQRSFLYRLKQKWNYYAARNDFERNVAEINRNHQRIVLSKYHFRIIGLDVRFNRKIHGFIIDRLDFFLQLANIPESEIILEKDQINFKTGDILLNVITAEEIYILYEIFVRKCYEVITEKDFNVIDVGLNVGFASLFFAQNHQVKRIYAFEPFKPTYEAALANFELNTKYSGKILPHNIGLGSKNEILRVSYNDKFKGKNSSLNIGLENTELIHIHRADEVIESIFEDNPANRFLIKMDCEGMEFEIFEIFKNKPLPDQLFGFLIEWHYRDPKPIIDVLITNHFRVHKTNYGKLGFITAFR